MVGHKTARFARVAKLGPDAYDEQHARAVDTSDIREAG